MVYLQTCRSRGKIYSQVKSNFVDTLLIYAFYLIFCLNKQMPIKRNFLGNLLIFFKTNGIAQTFDRHVLKVTGKRFDLLKPKSYLNRLEDAARNAT